MAAGHLATVDLIQSKTTPLAGVRIDPPAGPGTPRAAAGYPLERGTLLSLDGTEALLWTAGDALEVVNCRHYLKERMGGPTPMMLVRHAGRG